MLILAYFLRYTLLGLVVAWLIGQESLKQESLIEDASGSSLIG